MKNDDRIEMTILGQKRMVSLEELLTLYKQLDDPHPEENAKENFRTHKEKQERIAVIQEASKSVEGILKFLEREFSNDYDSNFDTFGGDITQDVFEVASLLPLEELEEFASRIREPEYSKKFQEIINKKKEEQEQEVR